MSGPDATFSIPLYETFIRGFSSNKKGRATGIAARDRP
jgi:hypothetical protein